MLRNGQNHLVDNDEFGPRRDILDMGRKYGRVCIMYHNDINNKDKWYKKDTAQGLFVHMGAHIWET